MMMADCADLPTDTPEMSVAPSFEEVHRVQQPGDCNESAAGGNTATTEMTSRNEPKTDTLLDLNNLPSQIMTEEPEPNISSELYMKSPKLDPGDVASSLVAECLDKSVSEKDPDESFEYIDTIDEPVDDNVQSKPGEAATTMYDINEANSNMKMTAPRYTLGSAMPVDNDCADSVLDSGRSTVSSVMSDASSITWQQEESMGSMVSMGSDSGSSRDRDEFMSARQSVNSSDSDNGQPAFKPGELTGKLIEGPRITLPPSQLSVVRSYPSPSPSPPVQGSSSDSEPNFSAATSYRPSSDGQPPNSTGEVNSALQPQRDSISKENVTSGATVAQPSCVTPGTDSSSIYVATTPNAPDNAPNMQMTTAASNSSDSTQSVKPKVKRTPNDFIFGKVIGEGSYSTVYLAKEVSTQREFAIKVCDKKHLIRERKTHFVMREKEVLLKLDHPFFIRLAYTFQDPERLYYVLTYARNGELLGYLHKLSAFDVPCTRFYSAEVVLALEYLHSLGIIHRDLKPENILLGEDMHIKITDFGTSKVLPLDSNGNAEQAEVKRKNSFVGTAEYVSPEILNNQPANYGSDLWALGCIIYQCLSGSLPFRSGNEYQTFQKIVKVEYDFPEGFNSVAKDLVQKLLIFEPMERLGMAPPEGMKALKRHPFYEGIDWDNLPQATPPKLMPYLPATANNPEFWGQEQRQAITPTTPTGFDDQRLAEIITGQTADGSMSPELEEIPVKISSPAEEDEKTEKLRKQRLENQFHQFVEDNLIIRQGFVDKRKGLFARKRMLLLTEGPHLYYVDAHNKVLKGEIPWSKHLRPEAKNFKIFFVHTPNRTYYLESRQTDAQQWVKQIKDVWMRYYGKDKHDN